MDFYGNIMWERWFVFYRESVVDNRWIAKLPNIFIHRFVGPDTPDGEAPHEHPWNVYGLILKGGYVEEDDKGNEVVKNAGYYYLQRKHEAHRLLRMQRDTWTIFAHGFRIGCWKFRVREHKTICEACACDNGGVCLNKGHEGDYGIVEYLNRMKDANSSPGWRGMMFLPWNEETRKALERRKAAVKALGLVEPASRVEAENTLKRFIIKKRKESEHAA